MMNKKVTLVGEAEGDCLGELLIRGMIILKLISRK
jgi:hypothetical protein